MGQQRSGPRQDEDFLHRVTRTEGPGSPGGLALLGRATEVKGEDLGREDASDQDEGATGPARADAAAEGRRGGAAE